MNSGLLTLTLVRWAGLVVIALAEVTCLAIRIEAPSMGILSYAKGLPSIFLTSLAVVTILGWGWSKGRVREHPYRFPLKDKIGKSALSAAYSNSGMRALRFFTDLYRFLLKDKIGKLLPAPISV